MLNPFRCHRTQELYVITTFFNPKSFKIRFKRYKEFEKRMLDAGVTLVVVEATIKGSNPEITEKVSRKHHIVHVDADSEIWLKENLINIGIEYLYKKFKRWKYMAMVDGDIAFVRPDWVAKTIEMLKDFHVIQMFSHITQLNSRYQPIHGHNLSFMEGWCQGLAIKNKKQSGEDPSKIRYGWCGAPGGAWAFTRKCINKIFPILDIGILGSGDFHMACSLIGYVELTFTVAYTEEYRRYIIEWQKKVKWLRGKVGHMSGDILHYWHGSIKNRGYETRWQLIAKHKFNPYTDLEKNEYGVWRLHKSKSGLIRDINEYFESRQEDEE